MKRIVHINSVCGFGSTGRIAVDLSKIDGYETLICYGRKKDYANVNSYKFTNFFDNAFGAARTILFDNNLNICTKATKRLIDKIKDYKPDIICLQNLHGYYINIEMLFKFLKEYDKPVIWTLQDCWALTGYCPHFDGIHCEKYKKECEKCPYEFAYPFSIFKQKVKKEYYLKKELFNSLDKLTIVVPSNWLRDMVNNSYLKNINTIVINNGIEIENFKPTKDKNNKFTALAITNYWTNEKGLEDLNKMMCLLDKDIDLVVVGKNSNKIPGAISIDRTENISQLVDLYSSSHIMINPTLQETFPTVNMESLACGTPILTYNTGGSPEIIDKKTGIVVERGDYKQLASELNKLKNTYYFSSADCVNRSKKYSKEMMKNNYKILFGKVLESE